MLNLHELTIKNKQTVPALDWELLAANAIGRTREYFFTHPEYVPTVIERLKLWRSVRLRKKGWPIAYILGHKEFFGLDFLVNKYTLVPRPETELMVEEVLKFIANSSEPIMLIDIGTGTGCIPIATANHLSLSFPRKWDTLGDLDSRFRGNDLKIFATDISHGALRVAQKNAKRHGVKIKFLYGNLLNPIIKRYALHATRYTSIIITANLPYLTAEQFTNEPSIQHEPKSALIAENQGLALYEELLKQINSLISVFPEHSEAIRYLNILIYLEIDPSQSERISKIISSIFSQANIQIKKDLAGRDRLVVIHLI